MTNNEVRIKHLEDTLTLQLGELYSIGEAHPDYHAIKERITIYATEYLQLTGQYFRIGYPVRRNGEKNETRI